MLSLIAAISTLIASIQSESTPNDVCSSKFSGTQGESCLEYGFCSSCVANGCYWCEPTNRCSDSNYECGSVNDKLLSLDQCNKLYDDAPLENPAVFSTNYSPHLAEILQLYAEYVYGPEDISEWDLFNLEEIHIFESMVTYIDSNTMQFPFYNLARGYKIIGDKIPGYDGPYYHGEQYNKDELINFINSLEDNSTYDLPFGDALIQLFDEHLVLQLPETNVLGKMRAFIGIDRSIKGIVISFRGTTHDFDDAASKSNVFFGSFDLWDASDISSLLQLHKIDSDVSVHGYFNRGYNALQNSIGENGKTFLASVQEFIQQYPGFDIYVTGHSLGGALANIFVLDLYAQYNINPSKFIIYTYGQPRVGNDAFAELINKIFNYEYYRVVHSNDIVPTVGPWIFNYRHNGIEIHYGEGDYKNGAICQYRECINLDPFEDPSCRSRYDDFLFGQDIFELTKQILSGYEYLKKIINDEEVNGEPVGPLANIIKLYVSPDEYYGVIDHFTDIILEHGHCSSNVKCIDQTKTIYVATENYKCLSLLSPFTNLVQSIDINNDIFKSTIFDKLNGCYGAGKNMMCCLGKSHGPLTVCKPNEKGWENWKRFGCSANDISEYCIINADCKDELNCIDGICTLTDINKVNIEKKIIAYISENEELRYWLYKLVDIKITSISNLYELFNIILSKLQTDNVKNKINKYANIIDDVRNWMQKIVDIEIDSIKNICELFKKILKEISQNEFNENIDSICTDLQDELQNIVDVIQTSFTMDNFGTKKKTFVIS